MSDGGSISRSCSKVVFTTLADFRARSTRRLQRAGSSLQDVRFSEQEVRAAIMRKKNGNDIPVEIFIAGGDKMVSLLCSFFTVCLANLHPSLVSRRSDVPILEGQC